MSKRDIKLISLSWLGMLVVGFCIIMPASAFGSITHSANTTKQKPPNILFIISDDQSYPHASAYGAEFVDTPNFDRIARNGLLFNNSFVSAPQCSPSRAAILTGRHIWQNGPAGTHSSIFPAGLTLYTDILKHHGYKVGYTGKGWGPGSWEDGGRDRNPAGEVYEVKDKRYTNSYPEKRFATGISRTNYAAGFREFLTEKGTDKPFCFWFGGHEPHRGYEKGSGLRRGKSLASVELAEYFPNADLIKSDMLDYAVEIEWFDQHVGKALDALEERGELKNTLVIFTGDNGMPFPRAKAFSFDAGTHTPLAIMWQGGPIKNTGRTIDDLISMVDIFPTILEAAGVEAPDVNNGASVRQGKSLFNIFKNGKEGITDPSRQYIFWGRERHSSSRWHNFGYPQRAVRSEKYLYIWNLKPERWPAGSPEKFDENDSLVVAYQDIDGSPTKTFMIDQYSDRPEGEMRRQPVPLSGQDNLPYFQMAFGKFPEEMLYNIQEDPYCINNLADDPGFKKVKDQLSSVLKEKLKETDDPRLGETPNVWNSYRRYGVMRRFPRPDWAKDNQ